MPSQYRVHFAEPNELTDDEGTELLVADYDDVGSMYILELSDGRTRSVGKQLVDDVTPVED
jgi:hypothetical protein